MSKKKKIILICAIVIVIIVAIATAAINKKKKANIPQNNTGSKNIETSYDNETGLYYVRDKETNEIIAASHSEEDLQFYIDNPDYNPNPMQTRPQSLEDYQMSEYESVLNETNIDSEN